MNRDMALIILNAADEHVFPFAWRLQLQNPIENLFDSCRGFSSRTEAVADFQRVCVTLGWPLDIVDVLIRNAGDVPGN